MKPADSVKVFESIYLPAGGREASPIRKLLQSVWDFYRNERPSGLAQVEGDMLLFQSGIYDWGSGPFFEIDLTRQFVESVRDVEEDVYSQFHLTCYYAPDEKLAALARESRWCADMSELEDLTTWVEGHGVLSAVDNTPRLKTTISWELV